MHHVLDHMAGHDAVRDETNYSPLLPSVQDVQAAHLFLVAPGGHNGRHVS